MDKFAVYHLIKSLQSIATQYPMGQEVASELAALGDQLSTRTYRVAVIGEFKRGKSSLVNCILGTQILPTDILPTTAAVNRIVYGTEQKITIHYKNGEVKTATVDELSDYATKLDKEKEAVAAQILEIVVDYPSVFCQNNIELLDTPGLNDDEFMDKTTLDVLDKIDTAIVTTHASYPISITEKKLICRLIEQDDIYHLTFVATFIDQVSDDPEDQDRVVKLIQNRLSEETYQLFCQNHSDDMELMKKAERILKAPVVFAVSSRLAMQGFINDNKKLLEESRFPYFKFQLSARLTANQELDLLMKAVRLTRLAGRNFDDWHHALMVQLTEEIEAAQAAKTRAEQFQKSGCEGLTDLLIQVDRDLYSDGIYYDESNYANSDINRRAMRIIMRYLLEIDLNGENRQTRIKILQQKLQLATAEVVERLSDDSIRDRVWERMKPVHTRLFAAQREYGMQTDELVNNLKQLRRTRSFPTVFNHYRSLLNLGDLDVLAMHVKEDNLVQLAEYVRKVVTDAMMECCKVYQEELKAYVASWRSIILKQNIASKNSAGELAEKFEQNITDLRQFWEKMNVNYVANKRSLCDTETELSQMMEN